MAKQSEDAVSGNSELDYSVESLDRLQEFLHSTRRDRQRRYSLGAYLGEVIRRNALGTAWAYPTGPRGRVQRRHPCYAMGRWVTDPLDYANRIAVGKAHPNTSLSEYFRQVSTFAASPTDDTATALGLQHRIVVSAPWDNLRSRWQDYRHEHGRGA